MKRDEVAEMAGIGYEVCCDVCCDVIDALEGVGFTEDQMIAIVLAMSKLKHSN